MSIIRKFACIFFLAAQTVNAWPNPFHWMAQHTNATAFIGGGISATVNAVGLEHCRRYGVEHCEAHYGAAWATFGADTGINFALISASAACRKDDGGKICNVLAYSGSAIQTSFGISQYTKGYKHEDDSQIQLRSNVHFGFRRLYLRTKYSTE